MAEASIPVDLFNPGQVFACLGFLEAAEILLGEAEGGFVWCDEMNVRFLLHAAGDTNPVERVLAFLANARVQSWGPIGYADSSEDESNASYEESDQFASSDEDQKISFQLEETFPASEGDHLSLPIRLCVERGVVISLSHWTDGSSRESFKLYAGNRSAERIAKAMLFGVREKPKKKKSIGDLKTKGISQLWKEHHDELIVQPFQVVTPMGGSFNFDPRGAWTAIDAGYSPNEQRHAIAASPVVEFLSAWALENARPDEFRTRKVRYAAWGVTLPPILARAAIAGKLPAIPSKKFRFNLDLSGKNKVVTFSTMENAT